MTHPTDDTIYEIAYKEATGSILTMDEVMIKNHFLECEECKDKFINYLSTVDFFANDFSDYFSSLLKDRREKQVQSSLAQAMVYHSLHLMIDMANNAMNFVQNSIAPNFVPFAQEQAAFARALDEEELRLLSEDSTVTYDQETNILAVSLDQTTYKSDSMQLVVHLSNEDITIPFEDNGFGYWEAEVEVIETDFTIDIVES